MDLIDGPHAGGKDCKLTVPKINPADSVVGEWVMVDMVREVSLFTHICLAFIPRLLSVNSGSLKTQSRWARTLLR